MKSKTFRLFVSSTFNDFIEERNILNKEVYPVIRDFCQEMGYDFQIVDLRWGVNHESAIAQNTMEICLTEVQRCRDYSPRPSFFVMIGERYGWCPLPYRIPSNSFREILNVIGSQMRKKLCMWYKEDLNHIGGEYRLISRGGIYSDDKVWEQTENEIREILRFAAFKTENEQMLKHVQASATAQEIYEGVFTRVKHSDHVIAFIRGVMNTGVSESDDIITLRNQVRKKLTDDGNDRNLFTLSLGMPAYADTFKCKTIELIKENIRQEIVRLERSNDNNLDKLYRSYLPDNSIMIDCAPRINTLKDYCFGLSARPLYVMGEPGSGKTTLLAILLEELQKSQNPPDMFYCLYGMDENSFSIISALCEIVRKIVLRYGIVCRRSLDKHSISLALEETLNLIPAGQNAVIVLDGVDGMNDLDDIHEQLLPVTLQSNVKVIVSSADQNVASKLGFVPEIDKNAVVLNQFLPKDCYNGLILELKNINRTITESSQKDQILMAFKNGATPLHVKLAAAICSRWSSTDTAPYLADNAKDCALQYISSMYETFGHNRDFCLYTLALIAAAPYGVTEGEIQKLVFEFIPVQEYLKNEDRYSTGLTSLPYIIWSRLFYDLNYCLTTKIQQGHNVVFFKHGIFKQVLESSFPQYVSAARNLLIKHFNSQSNYYGSQGNANTRKVLSLPILLLQIQDYSTICNLLCDFTFIDSLIRAHRIDDSINYYDIALDYAEKYSSLSASLYNLLRIRNCLAKHQGMLECYYNSFFDALTIDNISYGNIPKSNTPLLKTSIETLGYNVETARFPYPGNAPVVWSPTARKYAVISPTGVHICIAKTNVEECFIRVNAESIVWCSDESIVIKSSTGTLVYKISSSIPSITCRIEEEALHSPLFNEENHTLYLGVGDKLFAIDAKEDGSVGVDAELRYTVQFRALFDLDGKDSIGFDVIPSNNEIIYKDCPSIITVRNSTDGSIMREIIIRGIATYIDAYWDLCFSSVDKIKKIYGERFLLYNELRRKLKIVDKSGHYSYLLLPFNIAGSVRFLAGRDHLVVLHEDILYCIHIKDKFNVSTFSVIGMQGIAWVIEDERISVTTSNGMYIINLVDFTNQNSCFVTSRHNLNSNILFFLFVSLHTLRIIFQSKRAPRWIQDIIPKDQRYKKYFTNLQRELQGELSLTNLPYGRVSLLVFSDDGKQAYICEQDGTITITSQDKQVIMYIDRISLSIEDNILFATFNKASDLFMIWKNLSIQVFSVNNRSRIFYLNLNNRPALKVEFCEDGVSFDVTLVNNQSYHFRRVKNTFVPNCKLPSALSSDANSNTYGPYFAGHNGNTYSISSLIPYFSEEASPREWFANHCEFSVGNDSIIVKDSVLFCRRANGITTEIVGNVDLKKSHLIEQQQDGSFLETFLREKNILFTQFYEKIDTAESIIIMVSITLSSVIAIDTKSCRILDAIKIEGGIIGSHMTEGNVLTVYTKNGVFNYHVDCSLQKD